MEKYFVLLKNNCLCYETERIITRLEQLVDDIANPEEQGFVDIDKDHLQ